MTVKEIINKISLFYKNNKYISNCLLLLILYTIGVILYFIYNPLNLYSNYKLLSITISILIYFNFIMSLYFFIMRNELFGRSNGPSLLNFLSKIFSLQFIILIVIIIFMNIDYLKDIVSISRFIILSITILLGIALIIKIMNKNNNNDNSNLINSIKKIFLYLPYLLIKFIDYIKYQYSITTSTTAIIFFIEILLISIYFLTPIIYKKIILSNSKLLINEPLPLYNEYNLSSKFYLNNKENIENNKHDYSYGISCWFYINPQPPSNGYAFNNYTNILNYGNKPVVSYKNKTNTLKIEMLNKNLMENVIETNKVYLQKWNHLVINYKNGILDIFLNNELIKSVSNIIPYMNNDKIFSGSKNGIYGNISTLIYFNEPLTKEKINNIYITNKDKNPPLI